MDAVSIALLSLITGAVAIAVFPGKGERKVPKGARDDMEALAEESVAFMHSEQRRAAEAQLSRDSLTQMPVKADELYQYPPSP